MLNILFPQNFYNYKIYAESAKPLQQITVTPKPHSFHTKKKKGLSTLQKEAEAIYVKVLEKASKLLSLYSLHKTLPIKKIYKAEFQKIGKWK